MGSSPPHRGLSVYRAKAHADVRWWPMSTRVESSQATTLPQTPRQRAQFRTRLVALSCVVISPMEANRGAQDHSCRALVQQRVYARSARRSAPTPQRSRNCWHTKGPKPPTRNQSLPCSLPSQRRRLRCPTSMCTKLTRAWSCWPATGHSRRRSRCCGHRVLQVSRCRGLSSATIRVRLRGHGPAVCNGRLTAQPRVSG